MNRPDFLKKMVIVRLFNTRNTKYVRCTEIKVAVKFSFFTFHTSFDREYSGGQEYVCLGLFDPSFWLKN
jgi:hypothetical protein